MAKELPYFKFEPNQWENGNVQICTREDKGLFIDLCSMYWSRLGDVPFKLAVQKLCNGNADAFNPLLDSSIFSVIDDMICIDFLNEQLSGFEETSKVKSKNARDGWIKRRSDSKSNNITSIRNASASNPQSEINAIREDKRKEDKIIKEEIPTLEIFQSYALEKNPNLDSLGIKLKYESWVMNDWKDGNGKKIVNWRLKLNNTIPFLKEKQKQFGQAENPKVLSGKWGQRKN